MHLIAPLIAGVRGAENGRAEVYKRGTSSRATTYASFEGDGGVAGVDVDLDANGGAEVYVDELVDVKVVSSDGTAIRNFTAGAAASNVELVSSAFTGTDYETAASGASKPSVLEAIMDLWKTQNDALDWKVKVDGSTDTIVNFLSQVVGMVINVKDPTYGATGDGTTDDYTAIASAYAAATSGQIVYFPPGTYRVTDTIDVADDVMTLGSGSDSSIITIDHASKSLFDVTGDGTKVTSFLNLKMEASQASSADLFSYSSSPKIRIARAKVNLDGNFPVVVQSGSGAIEVHIADAELGVGSTAFCGDSAGDLDLDMERCRVTTQKTTVSALHVVSASGGLRVRGCVFDGSSVTSGSQAYVGPSTLGVSGETLIVGNVFLDGGAGSSFTGIDPNGSTTYYYLDDDNIFGPNIDPYASVSIASKGMWLGSREQYGAVVDDDSTSVGLPAASFSYIVLDKQGGGSPVDVTFSEALPLHHEVEVTLFNNGAAASVDFEFNAAGSFAVVASPIAVSDGDMKTIRFRCVEEGGGVGRYIQVGSVVGVTP